MRYRLVTLILALAVLLLGDGRELVRAEKQNLATFGALEPPDAKAVKAEAEAWAKASLPAEKMKKFQVIWASQELALSDQVVNSLLLNDTASRLMADARDVLTPAPTAVPPILGDAKQPLFFRANLAVAYAKALSNRRVYEEALATLKTVKPEEVVEPAVYLFHRAVAEHAMLQKEDAHRSIARLLDDVAEVPERYKAVGALMLLDMLTWRDKDLNWIARKMDNSGRRLQLARGGPVTQKIQKDIVRRLDELIKELENQAKGKGQCACGGSGGSSGNGGSAGSPMQDSNIATNGGPGAVDSKKFKKIVEKWGTLPERERRAYVQELTSGLSDKHRQAIYNYFKRLSESQRKRTPKT